MRGKEMTKSHAKGLVILIFVILFIQGVLFVFHTFIKEKITLKEINIASVSRRDSSFKVSYSTKKIRKDTYIRKSKIAKLFNFDPNNVGLEELEQLGFSSKQAQVIIKYRNKSGGFRSPEDFKRVFVVSESMYTRLKEFIKIAPSPQVKKDTNKITQSTKFVPQDKPEYLAYNPIDLNSADSSQLVSLPGIGPYFAKKIIHHRDRLGGFALKDQLMEIYGIDKERLGMFQERIIVDRHKIRKIRLTEATQEQLGAHPYIGAYVARAIIRFRESMGVGLCTLSDLLKNHILKPELATIMEFYID